MSNFNPVRRVQRLSQRKKRGYKLNNRRGPVQNAEWRSVMNERMMRIRQQSLFGRI